MTRRDVPFVELSPAGKAGHIAAVVIGCVVILAALTLVFLGFLVVAKMLWVLL